MNILVPFVTGALGVTSVHAAVQELALRDGALRLIGHVRVADSDAGVNVQKLRSALEAGSSELRAQGVACEDVWSVGPQTLASRVLEEARAWPAGLIVMGLRQRSRVGKLVLGSYEQSILLHAECPVLAVPVKAEVSDNRLGRS